jgi:hypothetical protein
MAYQEDLREKQVIALWAGHISSEDALVDYLGQPFENDFGFLLNYDALPEFAYAFESQQNPPDLDRKTARACIVPFDTNVDVRKLMAGFSHSKDWISEAVRTCHAQGVRTATILLAFPNLRYRPELSRNAQAPVKFIGNFPFPSGLSVWQAEERLRILKPPFPKLVRHDFGGEGSDLFDWNGIVRLESCKGFASDAELNSMGWSPTKGCLPDGDLKLCVHPIGPSISQPSDEQAKTLGHFLENETSILRAILEGLFKVYHEWRENIYGGKISRDGGKTWQSGWDLPDLYPPENMPALSSPDELRRLIRPQTLHVMANAKDGFTRIGLGFDCKWDGEHGLGVSTHKGNVVEVGSGEEAFAECLP